jgi:hypothetical protein
VKSSQVKNAMAAHLIWLKMAKRRIGNSWFDVCFQTRWGTANHWETRNTAPWKKAIKVKLIVIPVFYLRGSPGTWTRMKKWLGAQWTSWVEEMKFRIWKTAMVPRQSARSGCTKQECQHVLPSGIQLRTNCACKDSM